MLYKNHNAKLLQFSELQKYFEKYRFFFCRYTRMIVYLQREFSFLKF